jgi:RNA polymerase sigma-70 factor (ECF subfamily)
MSSTAHDALVTRASNGDAVAIESLLVEYLPRLRGYVRLQMPADLRAKESVSDVVQSVCREVLAGASGFEYRGEAAFRSWLFRVAFSKVHDRLRYHMAEKRGPGRDEPISSSLPTPDSGIRLSGRSPSQLAIAKESWQLVERAFDRLDPRDRQVVLLAKVEGLPRKEVAAQLGCSLEAAYSLLRRALARLALLIDGEQRGATSGS